MSRVTNSENAPPPVFAATQLENLLRSQHEFWEYWGFEPWSRGHLAGVSRTPRFVKSGILGPVAQYFAWEAIIWQPGTEEEREALWQDCSPVPDTMTQRFLFLLETPWPKRRIRSFALGFRGFVEFYAYWPQCHAEPKVRDLTGLVDVALSLPSK